MTGSTALPTSIPRRRKFWLIIGILVVTIAIVAFFVIRKKGDVAVAYQEVKPTRGPIRLSLLATGTVSPQNRLEIKPPIAGRVEEVLVKEGQRVQKGQLLAWMSSTERAALMDSARSQGEDEVKRWEGIYRPTPVMAPISGTIILRNVEAGQTFSNADAIFVMSDRLTIKAQVDETDIAQIRLKQPAEVILDAYSSERLPAVVDQIAFEAKTVNNVTHYVVDVLPKAAPITMRSGMTANVTFIVQEKAEALLIPTEAVQTDRTNGKPFVLIQVVGQKSKIKTEERPIKLGITDGKHTEVLEGVTESDTLLVAPLQGIGPAKAGASSPFGIPNMRGGRRGR